MDSNIRRVHEVDLNVNSIEKRFEFAMLIVSNLLIPVDDKKLKKEFAGYFRKKG